MSGSNANGNCYMIEEEDEMVVLSVVSLYPTAHDNVAYNDNDDNSGDFLFDADDDDVHDDMEGVI
eukprot:CAMPEP_0172487048 /NCGR_PEP_ID=MMETSP1066-20121228/15902_1 /TAXON_ID=671091 /ORGANISM="Coscinodiscus wailesii, Strain CCMP2513" /LENGTH=64 /DNA_ID=CAMNT_0013253397 /DNA_START=106 /DNA_END=296 /DNA_ORIENTATION=-